MPRTSDDISDIAQLKVEKVVTRLHRQSDFLQRLVDMNKGEESYERIPSNSAATLPLSGSVEGVRAGTFWSGVGQPEAEENGS